MEQKRKFSAFDIINIIVLGIGLVLTIVTMFTVIGMAPEIVAKIVNIIHIAAMIVAFISAAIYMIMRYTKKSAALYKIFMYSFVVSFAMITLTSMTMGTGSMIHSILVVIILLLSMLLATARDMGKVKTFIVAGLLLVANILMSIVGFGPNFPMVLLWPCIINCILTIEACIMVLAKYHDKDARGAK